jgi:hypothetical protein
MEQVLVVIGSGHHDPLGHSRSIAVPLGQYGIFPIVHEVELHVLLFVHNMGSKTLAFTQEKYCGK